MPRTIDWTCPVCLTESLDDYNVTKECWEEAGFIPVCFKEALDDSAPWAAADWWKGDFTYFRNTHIDCLEARLGRRFTVDDFLDAPCNIGIREVIASNGLVRLPKTAIGRKVRNRMITLDMLWRKYDKVS